VNAELGMCYLGTPQKEGVIEGVKIYVKCGSPETTILKDAIYCRACRNFQLFTKKTKCRIYNTGTTLNLD
jgi:hypothetical protein